LIFRFKHPEQEQQLTAIEIIYDETQTPPKTSILIFDPNDGTKSILEIEQPTFNKDPYKILLTVDLEENTASALIWKTGFEPVNTIPIPLAFPSGSIFNLDSEMRLCYDGQIHTKCTIQYLDIIFDERGGSDGALGLLYGIHRKY